MRLLSLAVCFIFVLHSFNSASEPSQQHAGHLGVIAVCISGQIGRMQPEHLRQSLVSANLDYFFNIYFNLHSANAVYTYRRPAAESPYAEMTSLEIEMHMKSMFLTENSKLESFTIRNRRTTQEWMDILQHPLDRITQFTSNQNVILNMYEHHQSCASDILQSEKRSGIRHQWVICTREDVYFFSPLRLGALLNRYMLSGRYCDLLTKDCLGWGGFNMRLQLMRRDIGLKALQRITFYRDMYNLNLTAKMPEIFEVLQANRLGITSCLLPVEEMPVTAARLSYINGSLCFIHPELKDYNISSRPCVPQESMDFAISHICPREKTRYQFIPWQSFAFVPNSAFPKASKKLLYSSVRKPHASRRGS